MPQGGVEVGGSLVPALAMFLIPLGLKPTAGGGSKNGDLLRLAEGLGKVGLDAGGVRFAQFGLFAGKGLDGPSADSLGISLEQVVVDLGQGWVRAEVLAEGGDKVCGGWGEIREVFQHEAERGDGRFAEDGGGVSAGLEEG